MATTPKITEKEVKELKRVKGDNSNTKAPEKKVQTGFLSSLRPYAPLVVAAASAAVGYYYAYGL